MKLLSIIGYMDISQLDLNLLRVLDAVYRHKNISRAAVELGMSQPATSQALTRLRLKVGDPLFERVQGGVRPTGRADRMARTVQTALSLLEVGLNEENAFDPLTSSASVHLHLTDIGEARFLPRLMAALHERAPRMQVRSSPWPSERIVGALDEGRLQFAIGYLPNISGCASEPLLADRYVLLVRSGHPVLRAIASGASAVQLESLEFVAVRSHEDTQRILHTLGLQGRVRLVVANFLALPAIVRSTNLAVLMPREVAMGFEPVSGFAQMDAGLPSNDFTVSLHWSRRFEQHPQHKWLRALILDLFSGQKACPSETAKSRAPKGRRAPSG